MLPPVPIACKVILLFLQTLYNAVEPVTDGNALTVNETVSVLLHPSAFDAVTVYTILLVTVVVTEEVLVEDSPLDGLQV